MLDIIRVRHVYLEGIYNSSRTKLNEFIEKCQSDSKVDDTTNMKLNAQMVDMCDASIRIKLYQDNEALNSDDESTVKAEFERLKKLFKSKAGREEILKLLNYERQTSEMAQTIISMILEPALMSIDDECGYMIQMIDAMHKFEGVFNTGQQGVPLDNCVGMLDQMGIKASRGEVAAELANRGLLDKNNKPTQKAIDEGFFKPSDS